MLAWASPDTGSRLQLTLDVDDVDATCAELNQKPGDFEAMQAGACSQLQGCHLIQGAGHWVQQEQPEAVIPLLLDFLRRNTPTVRP